ncbi:FAD/NAD(P)-binding domain-containing protein [Viridothelium virens]|uniref:FAD/NAD(P)-binding domain-containing protein n=1 Tax=Viridothelium virens TaxID=1048519 RepID=A0A6A6HBB5_VIRVR|nr:FAD/NAD(P)-binding domain-containing protein [Viridothelium virens]
MNRKSEMMPHVCVIGAGMSGLKCSETLLRNGAKVTIYEARDRTGGRVHQSDKFGHLLDLGPNWIHGTEHNPLVKLAKQTDSTCHDFGDLHSIFDCTGKYLDKEVAEKQTSEVWRILDEGFKYSEDHSGDIPKEKSLMDFIREKVDGSDYPPKIARNMLDYARMWGAMIGTEIERQSFRFFWLEQVIDGNSLFLASTYKKIVDCIEKKALVGANLYLSTEVTSIRLDNGIKNEDGQVEVRLSDGTSRKFDEVVVTAPLGWLKLHKNIFGHLEKAWVTFPTAWWHTASEHFPGETLFIRPGYAPDTNPKCWNQEIVSLAALPSPFSQPTIMFYLYGENSRMLTNRIHNIDPYSKKYYDILNAFFRPYYSKLPHFDYASDQCVPKTFDCTDWQHDPWAGYGSYSNFQIGLEHGDRDIEIYRSGMSLERGIWFAGEATAPFSVLGTVTGANWSGETVANKISARQKQLLFVKSRSFDAEPRNNFAESA